MQMNRGTSSQKETRLRFSDLVPYLGDTKCTKAGIAVSFAEACHVFFDKLFYSQNIQVANNSFNTAIQRFYESATQNEELEGTILNIKNESMEIWRKIVKMREVLLEQGIYVEIFQNEVGIVVEREDFKINDRPFYLYAATKLTEAHGITVNGEYVALSLVNAIEKAVRMKHGNSEFLRFVNANKSTELVFELTQLYLSSTATHETAHLLRQINGSAGKNEKYEEKLAYLYQVAYGPLAISYESFPLGAIAATRTETSHEIARYEIVCELIRKLGLDRIWDIEKRRQSIEKKITTDPDILPKLAKEILDYELGMPHERVLDIDQLKRAVQHRFITPDQRSLITYIANFRLL